MVADERTSLPTSSRQEDEFEFVVVPVIKLVAAAAVAPNRIMNKKYRRV